MLTLEDRDFIGQSLSRLEDEMAKGLADVRSEMHAGFVAVHGDIEKLARMTHDEFEAVHAGFDEMAEKLDALTVAVTRDHAYDIERLRLDVDRLKQHAGLN